MIEIHGSCYAGSTGGHQRVFFIHLERAPLNGERWLRQLYAQIDTLEQFHERCAFARERGYLDEDLRQLIFKSHRVIFHVDKTSGTVYVRHSGRRAAGESGKQER